MRVPVSVPVPVPVRVRRRVRAQGSSKVANGAPKVLGHSEPRELGEVLVFCPNQVGQRHCLERGELPIGVFDEQVAHSGHGRRVGLGLGLGDHGRVVARHALWSMAEAQMLGYELAHVWAVAVAQQLGDHARKGHEHVALPC